MKTVIDLIQEVKTLQASFTDVCRDLTEWEASQQQPAEVNIENFMRKGSCFPIQGHALSQVQEPLVQEAYLTLLLAVAEKDAGLQLEEHPVLYPCRVAVALPLQPDMKLYFKKSLLLDTPSIYQYVESIRAHQLEDVFLIDSLLLTSLYDKGNKGKLEFIADLAALWSVSSEKLEELLLIVQASLQEENIFCHDFRELCASAFHKCMPYLKTYTLLSVVFSESFYCTTFGKTVELTPELEHALSKQWASIKEKKEVLLKDVRFIRKETQEEAKIFARLDTDGFNRLAGIFSFSNIEKLSIVNCQFDHFFRPLFTASWVKKIEITQSSFTDFHGRVFRIEESTDSLAISQSTFSKCLLDLKACDCNQRGNYPNGCIGDVKGLRAFKSVECQFDSCYFIMMNTIKISQYIHLFSQGYVYFKYARPDWYFSYEIEKSYQESCQFQDEGSQRNNSANIFP